MPRVTLINLFLCDGIVLGFLSAGIMSFILKRNVKKREGPSTNKP